MTDLPTPPDGTEPVEEPPPGVPDASRPVEAPSGPGLGTGVIGGAIVGIAGAVVAALWFGAGRPTAPSSGDLTTGAPAESVSLPRPPSGADILPPGRTGGGALILENAGGVDAVVILADETRYSRAVYLRSGERVTVPNVAAGTYEVLMMLGLGWNGSGFTQTATYQQLDQAIEFSERDSGSGMEYTQLTVSVEPVTSGMAGVHQTVPFELFAP